MNEEKLILCAGVQLGKLTLLRKAKPSDPRVMEFNTPVSYMIHGSLWECACSCGNTCFRSSWALERRKVKSCGCVKSGASKAARAEREEKEKLRDLRRRIRWNYGEYLRARREGNIQKERELFEVITQLKKQKDALDAEIQSR